MTPTSHRPVAPSPAAALAPLSQSNLPELIADRIIEAVARRHLLPEQRLIETELSEQLSVSRVPLREALRILQSQGIVTALPRRGVRLVAFDAAWARALYDIRVALERLSSHAVVPRLRREAAARLRLEAAVQRLEEVAAGNDVFAMNAADLAVHTTIYELSGNPLLQTLWSAIARHVLVLFSIETYRIPDPRRVVAEHHELLHALLRGTPAQVDDTVARHVAGMRAGLELSAAPPRRNPPAVPRPSAPRQFPQTTSQEPVR